MASANELIAKLKHPGRWVALIGVIVLVALQFWRGPAADSPPVEINAEATP